MGLSNFKTKTKGEMYEAKETNPNNLAYTHPAFYFRCYVVLAGATAIYTGFQLPYSGSASHAAENR